VSPALSVRREVAMDTLVTIQVVQSGADAAIERALGWFHEIEERCSRFDPGSELMQLTSRSGESVPVSSILFESVRFALMVAEETRGAFDPTVGHRMEECGFNREHRTGRAIHTAIAREDGVSYRDVLLDPERSTITLTRPLILDLGAVAKGLAIDMAARELAPFTNFSIDAGGDLYFGGTNPEGAPWRVGIRHPRREDELICGLEASNQAVCTSGDYERGSHILDARSADAPSGAPGESVASVTVVAPNALLADALSTAAFALGPSDGIALLDRLGVDGLIVTPELKLYETRGLRFAA
jgi:FAD:protein FMN transferase